MGRSRVIKNSELKYANVVYTNASYGLFHFFALIIHIVWKKLGNIRNEKLKTYTGNPNTCPENM